MEDVWSGLLKTCWGAVFMEAAKGIERRKSTVDIIVGRED